MAIKSLVIRLDIDRALNSHNCQANAKHRIHKGDRRLKVRNGRSWDHYCVSCAAVMLGLSIEKLTLLQREFPFPNKQKT